MKNYRAIFWLYLIGTTGLALCSLAALLSKYLAPWIIAALYNEKLPNFGILSGKSVYTLEFYLHRLELLVSQTIFPLLLTTGILCTLLLLLGRALSLPRIATLTVNLLIFSICTVGSFLGAEVLLRLLGYYPVTTWKDQRVARHTDSGIDTRFLFSSHPRLGWVNSVGSFLEPVFQGAQATYKITIDEQGNRITSQREQRSEERVLFAGCSITFGS